jgi:hypothetical protein
MASVAQRLMEMVRGTGQLSSKASRPCRPEAALKYTPTLSSRVHFVLLCVHFAATFPKAPFR